MTIKSYFLAVLLLTTSSLHANSLYKFSNQPLSINQCTIDETNNTLDLALTNDGYFVISLGKKNSELLFTRYGRLMLDKDNYIVTEKGYYLLGINKKSDPNKLNKFKILL